MLLVHILLFLLYHKNMYVFEVIHTWEIDSVWFDRFFFYLTITHWDILQKKNIFSPLGSRAILLLKMDAP
jgi:hypothetical protein